MKEHCKGLLTQTRESKALCLPLTTWGGGEGRGISDQCGLVKYSPADPVAPHATHKASSSTSGCFPIVQSSLCPPVWLELGELMGLEAPGPCRPEAYCPPASVLNVHHKAGMWKGTPGAQQTSTSGG